MKYSGLRKLLYALSKLSKLNVFILLGYYSNNDTSILVYKFRPERTGFNMYAEYTRSQLTFLALEPCFGGFFWRFFSNWQGIKVDWEGRDTDSCNLSFNS